jgi:hypothetical protein
MEPLPDQVIKCLRNLFCVVLKNERAFPPIVERLGKYRISLILDFGSETIANIVVLGSQDMLVFWRWLKPNSTQVHQK